MNKHEEYATLKDEIKRLTKQAEAIGKQIIEEMVDAGQDSLTLGIGKFTLSPRKTWTYPDRVTALGEKFDAEKAKAQSTGEATYEEKNSLLFTAVNL